MGERAVIGAENLNGRDDLMQSATARGEESTYTLQRCHRKGHRRRQPPPKSAAAAPPSIELRPTAIDALIILLKNGFYLTSFMCTISCRCHRPKRTTPRRDLYQLIGHPRQITTANIKDEVTGFLMSHGSTLSVVYS